jgi:hypothetical protein
MSRYEAIVKNVRGGWGQYWSCLSLFFLVSCGGVRLNPLGTSASNWPIVPAPDDRWWWVWSSRGTRFGRAIRSARRKHAPVPLCPPQIPHDLTWTRKRAAALGTRRLTAWAMVRSLGSPLPQDFCDVGMSDGGGLRGFCSWDDASWDRSSGGGQRSETDLFLTTAIPQTWGAPWKLIDAHHNSCHFQEQKLPTLP